MHGILLARGPGIQQNTCIENASLVDIAPTLLYSLGLGIPTTVDGDVLLDLFSPEYLQGNPPQFAEDPGVSEIAAPVTDLTPEDEEQIIQQLERLGYL